MPALPPLIGAPLGLALVGLVVPLVLGLLDVLMAPAAAMELGVAALLAGVPLLAAAGVAGLVEPLMPALALRVGAAAPALLDVATLGAALDGFAASEPTGSAPPQAATASRGATRM